jgi:Tfp pilus assembly protein PilF
VLRAARALRPDDGELADKLVTALAAGDRHLDARAVLDARLAAADERGAGERAALLIRRAQVQADGLRDVGAARASLAAALALVPDHPTALAAIDRLTSAEAEPAAYAAARLRAADAATDDDARVVALYQAGVALRDGVGDAAGARAAFERALGLRPLHADVVWALAGLVEQGDPAEATRLLETRLADAALTAGERARVLTQLAALARAGGEELVAERRLVEAIDADPGHLSAIVALLDLRGDAGRWADVENFLRGRLADGVPGASPAVHAELNRRLADAQERLGDEEQAYQTLLTADRLHRGHALIKLALGENRFRARRWREAALHLAALATHDEAAAYPAEVAQGLHHAALAEVRSLRPEKAPALWARALELRPSYPPALAALAELTLEQGDALRAAELFTRQATATDDPPERVRLFEALGDLCRDRLADEDRARVCYAAAVAAAQPLEARHLPLLAKLLAAHDRADDRAGAARTAELMAAFDASPAEQAARLARAARDFGAAGDSARARAAAERAVALEPQDLDAVDLLSAHQIADGDGDAAAALLARALAGKDGTDPAGRAVRARLWLRLGEERERKGDVRSARAAYDRAIALGGDGPAATAARRHRIAALAADPARTADGDAQLAAETRAVAQATGGTADLAGWSDELRRTGKLDEARAALDLAAALGHALDDEQAAFAAGRPPHWFDADEAYRGALDADAIGGFLADPDDAPLAAIFATLAEAAGLLWPDAADALARAGVTGARPVSATTTSPAAIAYPHVAAALATGPVRLYLRDEPGAPPVQVVCAATPLVVLGPRLQGDLDLAARFQLGRAAELTRPARMVAIGLAPADLRATCAALVRNFAPPPLHAAIAALVPDVEVQRARDEAVRGALPVKLRLRFEQQFAGLAAGDLVLDRFLAACERVADRAGMLVSGDPSAALASAADRGLGPASVLRAGFDPAYAALRARLGVGVRG